MLVFTEISTLRKHISNFKAHKKTIGLVPTMGALHDGHLSLVRSSVKRCDVTVVSIFINPMQFNNEDDLAKYPRTFDEDLKLLENENVDIVFAPPSEEIYPERPTLSFDFGPLERIMEGKFRPGHFKGVAIVVSKLFNIVSPDFAFFGQKDFQQLLIIRKLQAELSFPIKIISVPTVREKNGLAMSSRNTRLSKEGKDIASELNKSLEKAKKLLIAKKSPAEVRSEIILELKKIEAIELEYFEIVNPVNLEKFETNSDIDSVAICIAAYVEGIRLIDNLYLRL